MTRKSTRRNLSNGAVQPSQAGDCRDLRVGEEAAVPCDVPQVETHANADLAAQATLDPSGSQADRALADRCLLGDVAAWEEIYHQCHDPLCVSIKSLLGPGFHDPNLVDDIAARVWYALVKNDGELLDRFDPSRDLRLGVFLRGLARVELMQYFRAERRRLVREAEAGRKPSGSSLNEWQIGVILNEFTATLTPGERQFVDEYLLSLCQEDENADGPKLTDANIWQRRHRIRSKLLKFFGKDA
jgi:hypothetical protein